MMKDYTQNIEELKPIKRNIDLYLDEIYQHYYQWDRIAKTVPGEEFLLMQMKHVETVVATFLRLQEAAILMEKILKDPDNDPQKTEFRQNLDEAERLMTEIVKVALEKLNFQETGTFLQEEVKKLLIETNNRVIRHLQELKTVYNVFITKFNETTSTSGSAEASGLQIFMYPIFISQETEDFFKSKK